MDHRPRRRTKIGGQFAPRLIEMLESRAWRALSLSGRRVLDRVEIELAHHGGTDNGRLPVTYDDFVNYGIDRHAVGPAIREAVALGFLEVTERGRAGNREFRSPNKFRLTYVHGYRRADEPTHEWRRIDTVDQAIQIREKARANPTGFQFARRPSGPGKHKSNGDSRSVSVGEPPTENRQSPVGETPTTAKVEKPPQLSISGDGARSAPTKSAEASAPSATREGMVPLIMRSVGCTRAEAIKRFDETPDLNGVEASGQLGEQNGLIEVQSKPQH